MTLRSTRDTEINLAALSAAAPARAGDLAFRRFCTPRLSERRSADHDLLTERARHHLRNARWVRVPTSRGEMQSYILEPDTSPRGETVMVVHGWTSESSFMTVFAEPIRRAGYRVLLVDQPAHGKSDGEVASLIDCAQALLEVAEALGPVRHVVAHSMGCLAALLVGEGGPPMPRRIAFDRYVLVACPNRFGEVTAEFGDSLGLSAEAQRIYERRLERIAHRTIASFTGANLLAATGCPTLLLHARDDEEVAFSCAEQIVDQCPAAQLQPFDGLGHRMILYATPAARAAVAFLNRKSDGAKD
ncbi:MAG: alpha/beta fold hydrolase [Hyphomicrobium sp.]